MSAVTDTVTGEELFERTFEGLQPGDHLPISGELPGAGEDGQVNVSLAEPVRILREGGRLIIETAKQRPEGTNGHSEARVRLFRDKKGPAAELGLFADNRQRGWIGRLHVELVTVMAGEAASHFVVKPVEVTPFQMDSKQRYPTGL